MWIGSDIQLLDSRNAGARCAQRTFDFSCGGKVSKLSFKGVFVGGITDIVATNILAIPIIVYLMQTKIGLAHLPSNQIGPAVTAALHANGPLFALGTLL